MKKMARHPGGRTCAGVFWVAALMMPYAMTRMAIDAVRARKAK